MFEELKKKTLKSSLLGSIILILAGLGLAGWNALDAFYSVIGYTDFTTIPTEDISSQLVTVDLKYNFGCYLEEYEKNTKTGSTKTTHLYYVIGTEDVESPDIDWKFMSIKVPASYASRMDKMYEGDTTPVTFSGKIKKLDAEETRYFREYFEEAGFTDAEIDAATIPYYIQCFASPVSMSSMYIVLFAVGALLLIWGIVRVVKVTSGASLSKLRKDITAAGYTEASIDSDYRNAKSFDKKGSLKVGRLMTYYLSGSSARAINNSKMMWAYQNTVTHRTNGVKTGTTYNVMVFDEATPKGHSFSVANEAVAQEMLQRINDTLPWVVVGYSDELKKLYNKSRTEFLNLRYNTCPHEAVDPEMKNPDAE